MTELSLGLTSTTNIRIWVRACLEVHYSNLRSYEQAKSGLTYFATFAEQQGKPFAGNIDQKLVDAYKLALENRSLSPETINKRLSQLSRLIQFMGQHNGTLKGKLDTLKIKYVNVPKNVRKWHLTDEQDVALGELLGKLIADPTNTARERLIWQLVEDYFDFTTETGLRVEEVLRLLPSDFRDLDTDTNAGLIVPGTKTEGAEAYIPISINAAIVARERIAANAAKFDLIDARAKPPERRVFDISYDTLKRRFNDLKGWLGWPEGATLKGLRRTFAGRALRKGLDIRVVQEIMRHTSEETTRGYLKLFGMANNPETRALLNKSVGAKATYEKVNDTTIRATKAGNVDLAEVLATLFGRPPGVHDTKAEPNLRDDFAEFIKGLGAAFPGTEVRLMGIDADGNISERVVDPYPPAEDVVHFDGTNIPDVTCPKCLQALKRVGALPAHG